MSSIKFSKQTMAVLDNFAQLNPACSLEQGNVIRTSTPSRSMLAIVKIEETIPEEFRIHNLAAFLTMLKLPIFEECDIDITSTQTVISNDKASQKFTAAASSLVQLPPKEFKAEHSEIKFQGSISSENLSHILKVVGTLKHDAVEFRAEAGKLKLVTRSLEDADSSNTHELIIGATDKGDYTIVVKTEYLKLINTDYNFCVGPMANGKDGLTLKSQDANETISYMIGAEVV